MVGPLRVVNAKLHDRLVDIVIEDGWIRRIVPAGESNLNAETLDAKGNFISPPYADPHLHLDAVLLAHTCPNQSGTLVEGINNWSRARDQLTEQDWGLL